MFTSITEVLKIIKSNEILFIDLYFTDFNGRFRHKIFNVSTFNISELDGGLVSCGDLMLIPILSTGFLNPFTIQRVISFICNTSSPIGFDWRAACSLFVKEISPIDIGVSFFVTLQFSIFDNISFDIRKYSSFYKIDSGNIHNSTYNLCNENFSSSGLAMIDDLYDLRSEITDTAKSIGIEVVSHANGDCLSSALISFKVDGIIKMADKLQLLKLVIVNTVKAHGKIAVFMDGFIDQKYHPGIILSHIVSKNIINSYACNIVNFASSLCAFVAPMSLGGNRFNKDKINWIVCNKILDTDNFMCEYNFIDGVCNPYGALGALFASGLFNLNNKYIDNSVDLQYYSPNKLPYSLAESLDNLSNLHNFVLKFISKKYLDIFLIKKSVEAKKILATINPIEFEFYYNL